MAVKVTTGKREPEKKPTPSKRSNKKVSEDD